MFTKKSTAGIPRGPKTVPMHGGMSKSKMMASALKGESVLRGKSTHSNAPKAGHGLGY